MTMRAVVSNNLSLALAISLAVHGTLLCLRLAAPEPFDRLFDNAALDVILVNSRVRSAPPDKAQALAQTQLAGGGEQAQGRATSPLPTAPDTLQGTSAQTMQRQLKALQNEQSLLLAQIKQALSALPPPQPKKELSAQDPVEEKRRQMLKLLAEIEERINQENARPRKHYVSPATREVPFALYYDGLRQKIEERGTRYFPEHDGQKLYGELTMIITVHADGRVLKTEVVQSSGQPELDHRAQAIATAAGPFGHFTRDMQQQADQLAVISRFIFSRDNALHTQSSEGAR